jgi:hypothetical protein
MIHLFTSCFHGVLGISWHFSSKISNNLPTFLTINNYLYAYYPHHQSRGRFGFYRVRYIYLGICAVRVGLWWAKLVWYKSYIFLLFCSRALQNRKTGARASKKTPRRSWRFPLTVEFQQVSTLILNFAKDNTNILPLRVGLTPLRCTQYTLCLVMAADS